MKTKTTDATTFEQFVSQPTVRLCMACWATIPWNKKACGCQASKKAA